MYPVNVTVDYGDGERHRGLAALGAIVLLKSLLALPHWLIVGVLSYVAAVVGWIGYWVIAITGRIPDFFYTFPERIAAWQVRTYGWLYSFTDTYPPFEWEPTGYPVALEIDEGPGERSRVIAVLGIIFLKAVALVPHAIVLVFVSIAAVVVLWISYLAILFTGRYPRGMFDFLHGWLRWTTRLGTWVYSLTDRYPPFALKS